LTHEEIVRWFRRFRYDPEFRNENGAKTVPIRMVCELANVPFQHVYAILRGDMRPSKSKLERLEKAILAVERGLRWSRHGSQGPYEVNDERYLASVPVHDKIKYRVAL
jgi:hypothetical protein